MSDCPPRDVWRQVLDDAVPDDLSRHLERCCACQALVADLTQGSPLWRDIAAVLRRPAAPLPSACRHALAAARNFVPDLASQLDAVASPGVGVGRAGGESVPESAPMKARIHIERMMHRSSIAVSGASAAAYTLLKLIPDGQSAPQPLGRNLALALDVSGSMYEQDGTGLSRLRRIQDAAVQALHKLRPDDTLAVIGFAHNAQVVLPPTPLAEMGKIEDVLRRIDMFDVDPGGTAMDEGLALALTDIEKHAGPGKLSQVLVLTDGETAGEQNCRTLAQRAAKQNIRLSLMGVGTEWNGALIKDLAQLSQGKWYYIDVSDAQEAGRIFDMEFASLAAASFLDVELCLRPMKDVHIKRIRQVAPEIRDLKLEGTPERGITVKLGTLCHDASIRYIIDLSLPKRPDGKYVVAQLEASYDVGTGRRETSGPLPLEMTYTAAGPGYINAEVMRHIDDLQLHGMSETLQLALGANDRAAAERTAREMQRKGGQMGDRAKKKTMLAGYVLNELQTTNRVSKKTQLALADVARLAETPPPEEPHRPG